MATHAHSSQYITFTPNFGHNQSFTLENKFVGVTITNMYFYLLLQRV